MAECPTCGDDDFASRRGMKQHHAKAHGDALGHDTVNLTCDWCGDSYEKRKDRAKNSRFCSGECQRQGRSTRGKERQFIDCEVCNETFSVHPNDERRFCSPECFHLWRSDHMSGKDSPLYEQKEVTCAECGTQFEREPSVIEAREEQYCSRECYYSNYTGKNAPRWKGGCETYYGKTWSTQRQKTLERDNHECQDCDLTREEHYEQYDQDLEVHHKTPIRTFEDTAEANQLENLVTLCKSCHQQRESKIDDSTETETDIMNATR